MEKPKPKKPEQPKTQKGKVKSKSSMNDDDAFDFGGFSSGLDLKKNIGCGG